MLPCFSVLVRECRIIAIQNLSHRSLVLYPRGIKYLTALSGTVSVDKGRLYVSTTHNLVSEIRRGDALRIDGHICRVSTAPLQAVKTAVEERVCGFPLIGHSFIFTFALQFSHSASSVRPRSSRTEYALAFTAEVLPLESPFPGESVRGVVAHKEGNALGVNVLV
jgi:hypothetical protein